MEFEMGEDTSFEKGIKNQLLKWLDSNCSKSN
jgi:hypothetical protein